MHTEGGHGRSWHFSAVPPTRKNFSASRLIIADLTDPSSIPQKLQAIIPSVRATVQPLLLKGFSVYSMFKDFDPVDFHWVLPIY
jgi:hypothetical protein